MKIPAAQSIRDGGYSPTKIATLRNVRRLDTLGDELRGREKTPAAQSIRDGAYLPTKIAHQEMFTTESCCGVRLMEKWYFLLGT